MGSMWLGLGAPSLQRGGLVTPMLRGPGQPGHRLLRGQRRPGQCRGAVVPPMALRRHEPAPATPAATPV